jgi:hypothetical protein
MNLANESAAVSHFQFPWFDLWRPWQTSDQIYPEELIYRSVAFLGYWIAWQICKYNGASLAFYQRSLAITYVVWNDV